MLAYKLFKQRKDGTIGPLFINKTQVIKSARWLPAESHPTKGYALRPGWHVTNAPVAPHLSKKGRVWKRVEIKDYTKLNRPAMQGGLWYLANWMRVLDTDPSR
jgi:hypothetical protein